MMEGTLLNKAHFSKPFVPSEADVWLSKYETALRKGQFKAARDFKKHYDKIEALKEQNK